MSEGSILTALERAELAARERRLAAEGEAERLVEAARAEAREIEAGVDERASAAVADLRARLLGGAREEVAAIEAELARLDQGRTVGAAVDNPARAAFEQAVECVVAAVLGESTGS